MAIKEKQHRNNRKNLQLKRDIAWQTLHQFPGERCLYEDCTEGFAMNRQCCCTHATINDLHLVHASITTILQLQYHGTSVVMLEKKIV